MSFRLSKDSRKSSHHWIYDNFTHPINRAEFPDDSVQTLESNEHVNVEADSVVKTQ